MKPRAKGGLSLATTSDALVREERLDRYRLEVEGRLGARLGLVEEEDFERFFVHVEASFDRRLDEGACASAWLGASGEGAVHVPEPTP